MFTSKVRNGFKVSENLSDTDLATRAKSRVFVVIGGTKGLGRALADHLAKVGAKRVIVVGRSFEPGEAKNVEFVKADLSLMKDCESLFIENETLREILPEMNELIMTVGIMTSSMREETAEGIERDLAVSYLSRLAILDSLVKIKPQTNQDLRVWVMGFPGAKENPGNLDDLNAEKEYKAMPQHMKTVVGNEAIVHHYAKTFATIGLNPGLIKTDIRQNLLGTGFLSSMIEFFINLVNPSPDQYGQRVSRLILAPELDGQTGLLFDRDSRQLEPNPWLTPDNTDALITKSLELIQARKGETSVSES